MFDPQTAGTATIRDLDAIIDRLSGLAAGAWASPVRCEGWDVTALAAHLVGAAQGQAEGLRRAVAGRVDVPPLAASVVPEPGPLVEALADGRDQLAKAFASLTPEVMDGVIPLPFGLMPAGAAIQIIPIEYGFHRNDLEWALGNTEPLDADAAEALVQILPGLLPILAGGSAVSPAGELPTEAVAYQLTAPSGTVTIAFCDGAWSVDAGHEGSCDVAGDDGAIALFALGRIPADDERLTVTAVTTARAFKVYFPGP
jgi:uncharacterized protein (TIGR03083 family)